MKHVYISLGSGCDVATNLRHLGIRKNSLPFDWLWNLNLGLEFVNSTISNDFKDILDVNDYVFDNHYRFNKKFVLYKNYPLVAHIHSNPINNYEDHLTLQKRIIRLKNILNENSYKHFIYYRSFEEDLLSKKVTSIEEEIKLN